MVAYFICPEHVSYETLGLWPKDDDGNDIIDKNWDPSGWKDNLHITATWGCFALTSVMMWSLIHGQMTGHLYIDRIKRDRRAAKGLP